MLSVAPAPAISAVSPALMASLAMREEVLLTPKPGLVDQVDRGAHSDMDLPLFLKSADAVAPFLLKMADLTPPEGDASSVLPFIRPVGQDAEKAMLHATGGINTHKGQIFSLGVCTAAAVRTTRRGYPVLKVLEEGGHICRGISSELVSPAVSRTNGGRVYRRCGSKGARGEAEAGFPSVRSHSYPAYRTGKAGGLDHNGAALHALLHLMLKVEDSNVLHRRGEDGLELMRRETGKLLAEGGMFLPDAYGRLENMNRLFVRENISPGGCADLLALTLFLVKLEEMDNG